MDNVSETRLGEVYPGLADKVRSMAQTLETEGIDIRVTQSLRTWTQQQALFNQGRDANGNIIDLEKVVTKAPPGYSWHNFGLAVDVAPITPQGIDWNTKHPVWQRIVSVGLSVGFTTGEEGADWRTFPDWPHFELTGRFPIIPDDEARTILRSAGLQAVWNAAFGDQAVEKIPG